MKINFAAMKINYTLVAAGIAAYLSCREPDKSTTALRGSGTVWCQLCTFLNPSPSCDECINVGSGSSALSHKCEVAGVTYQCSSSQEPLCERWAYDDFHFCIGDKEWYDGHGCINRAYNFPSTLCPHKHNLIEGYEAGVGNCANGDCVPYTPPPD